jgi:DNA-binding NtrC family response regulator
VAARRTGRRQSLRSRQIELPAELGNIRELENIVERVLIASRGTRFELVEETAPAESASAEAEDVPAEARTLAQLERDHLVATRG